MGKNSEKDQPISKVEHPGICNSAQPEEEQTERLEVERKENLVEEQPKEVTTQSLETERMESQTIQTVKLNSEKNSEKDEMIQVEHPGRCNSVQSEKEDCEGVEAERKESMVKALPKDVTTRSLETERMESQTMQTVKLNSEKNSEKDQVLKVEYPGRCNSAQPEKEHSEGVEEERKENLVEAQRKEATSQSLETKRMEIQATQGVKLNSEKNSKKDQLIDNVKHPGSCNTAQPEKEDSERIETHKKKNLVETQPEAVTSQSLETERTEILTTQSVKLNLLMNSEKHQVIDKVEHPGRCNIAQPEKEESKGLEWDRKEDLVPQTPKLNLDNKKSKKARP